MLHEVDFSSNSKIEINSNIQKFILRYLDDVEFEVDINQFFDEIKIRENLIGIKDFFILIRNIIDFHHRNHDFYQKIEKILIYFKEDIKQIFSNTELFEFFSNPVIIIFFIENKMIKIDEIIFKGLKEPSRINFFLPEIESYYMGHSVKNENNERNYKIYDETRKLGENNDDVCRMIRNDSVEEFISYVNQKNLKLNSIIKYSHFESNKFLIDKEPTLIEYAAFFGSIQIFQYLKMNKVKLNNSLWLFAIHSNNAQLIHILEEENVVPIDKTFKECLMEAIKCNHNEIANYILNEKYLPSGLDKPLLYDYLKYNNYNFMIIDSSNFLEYNFKVEYFYNCIKTFTRIVDLLISEKYVDTNIKIVFIYQFY